jgi:hypothetical protein
MARFVLVVCSTTSLNLGGTFSVAVYSRVKREGVKTIFRPLRHGNLEQLRILKMEKHNRMYMQGCVTTIYKGSVDFDSKKTLSRD